MDQVKDYTNKFEDVIERLSAPVKPFLPLIARFLLVVTFLEDSLRIITQWDDQCYYLERHRGFPGGLSQLFLAANVIAMTICSVLAIMRRHTETACAVLAGVIITQSIGYGLLFDLAFFLRNLSVAGGLVMLIAESQSSRNKQNLFPGLLRVSETDKSAYLVLLGRVLLVGLFLSFIFAGEWSFFRVIVALVSFVGCVMIVVGFKAKWTAWFLVTFLSISNVMLNNWWSLHHLHPNKDFLKYDFFQTLSVIGGFLLLSNLGPGGLSMDEKKKNF